VRNQGYVVLKEKRFGKPFEKKKI